jgi:hypothetical protein
MEIDEQISHLQIQLEKLQAEKALQDALPSESLGPFQINKIVTIPFDEKIKLSDPTLSTWGTFDGFFEGSKLYVRSRKVGTFRLLTDKRNITLTFHQKVQTWKVNWTRKLSKPVRDVRINEHNQIITYSGVKYLVQRPSYSFETDVPTDIRVFGADFVKKVGNELIMERASTVGFRGDFVFTTTEDSQVVVSSQRELVIFDPWGQNKPKMFNNLGPYLGIRDLSFGLACWNTEGVEFISNGQLLGRFLQRGVVSVCEHSDGTILIATRQNLLHL